MLYIYYIYNLYILIFLIISATMLWSRILIYTILIYSSSPGHKGIVHNDPMDDALRGIYYYYILLIIFIFNYLLYLTYLIKKQYPRSLSLKNIKRGIGAYIYIYICIYFFIYFYNIYIYKYNIIYIL